MAINPLAFTKRRNAYGIFLVISVVSLVLWKIAEPYNEFGWSSYLGMARSAFLVILLLLIARHARETVRSLNIRSPGESNPDKE